jgi:hypothetical protein
MKVLLDFRVFFIFVDDFLYVEVRKYFLYLLVFTTGSCRETDNPKTYINGIHKPN